MQFRSKIQKVSRNNQNTPKKSWGHTSIQYKEFIYFFGGKLQEKVYRFNCLSYNWVVYEPSKDINLPCLESHSAVVKDHQMIIFGGNQSALSKQIPSNEIYIFDLNLNQWSYVQNTIGEKPEPREGHCCCLVKNKYMFIQGGYNSEQEYLYRDSFIYDIPKNQ